MSFDLKTYRRLKIKYYFKKIKFFFFFHGTSLNITDWTSLEQLLDKEKLKCFQILNSLMVRIINNSIFRNLKILINGLVLLLHTTNKKLTLKKLNNISSLLNLLCLKLNNKIYSKKQIKNLKKLSYIGNIYLFYSFMLITAKMPYYKLKSKKKN